jgi:hypothetical protein
MSDALPRCSAIENAVERPFAVAGSSNPFADRSDQWLQALVNSRRVSGPYQMVQTNVVVFPSQPPESERLRLYRDDPCVVVFLAVARPRDWDPPYRSCATSAGCLNETRT